MTIFVINIGNTIYSEYSLPLIKKLCEYNSINLYIIDKDIPENIYKLHPSWLKLFCHKLVDDDFIICWDLDLVPVCDYDIISNMNTEKLNFCYDRDFIENGHLWNDFRGNGRFKYNCGLVGIPKSYQKFMEDIYYKHGEHANLPSYEQYYVNTEIIQNNIDINLLDSKFNFMFDNSNIYPDDVRNIHYTWKIKSNEHRIELIKAHYKIYI